MKIDRLIINLVLAAMLGLEGWTLREVVAAKIEIASLRQQIQDHIGQGQITPRMANK